MQQGSRITSMGGTISSIKDHWRNRDNLRRVKRELERVAAGRATPTIDRLAAHDQMHSGTLEGTRVFIDWVGGLSGRRVLDLGSGLGGVARLLATEQHATVTAVELVPELDRTAAEVTRRMGLDDRVRHLCADLSDELDQVGQYDIVWIQHVDMQVPDKQSLYRCALKHLATGGRVVWHDWLAGQGGEPRWPLFWSADGSLSFLLSESELRAALRQTGLTLSRFESIPDLTTRWYQESRAGILELIAGLESTAATVPRRHKLGALLSELENALESIAEERLVPFFAEACAAGDPDVRRCSQT
jgi:predicted O-methyltransferase YrrM